MESFIGPDMDLSPTASKLDTSVIWFAALAEQAALGLFQRFGIASILERNARLSTHLHDALAERYPAFQPFSVENRSTIVSVPFEDSDAVVARLRAANVVATFRAGRVRLAVHFYNLEEELDRVVDLIAG
jgi:selenocysteine lyase/cysteine desulfurase